MSKMSKAIAVLGVVAGLGVAALPLSSYAASSQSAAAQVQVEVGGSISIAIVDPKTENANTGDVTFTAAADGNMAKLDLGKLIAGGAPKTGNVGVEVSTNDPTGYALTIAPVSASATSMTGTTGGEIPAGSPANGTSAWGFKVVGQSAWQSFDGYTTPIALTGAESETKADADSNATKEGLQSQTDVTFGVSASSTQLEGIYTGTAVFTATVQ